MALFSSSVNRTIPSFFPLTILSPAKRRSISLSAASQDSAKSAADAEPQSSKPAPSSGQGFGPPRPDPGPARKQKGGRRERSSVIRRTPVERPAFLDKKDGEVSAEQSQSETAFVVAWLALGALILAEGIALAASGFLPEQWDSFFVKYLYPSFTPTVGLFVAGSVAYGVLKYFQNENAKNQN